MLELFDYSRLRSFAAENRSKYASASPFPHIAIDDVANATILREVVRLFPDARQLPWFKYDNPLEKKLAYNRINELPTVIREVLVELNSGSFTAFLQELTSIDGLLPDPEYNGGGLHRIERGGKLDIHADYNVHYKTRLDRRLNVLLYLNLDWQESYGGHIEFWDRGMTRPVSRYLPLFNRMVIFNTTDFSFHGHPNELTCPEGISRKSIAIYFYTNGRPEGERAPPHSTLYKKRPQDPDDPQLEALRQKRAKGRLTDGSVK